MKPSFSLFVLFLLLFGCNNEDKLTFESYQVETEACDNCVKVIINLPKALDKSKLAQTVNTALVEEVISLLHFDDESEVSDIDTAIESYKLGFKKLQEKYEDETTPWEAKIYSEITFENTEILTISVDAFIFTGGAHGYTSKRFLNFDKKKGTELDNLDLFKNTKDFRDFVEKIFREKESIPKDKSINYTGFMFEQDSFYLPENIGFTEKGLKLLYNPYEVASYADGTIELVLPHSDVKKYLAKKPKS